MKNILNILFAIILVGSIQAQNIDVERMHRDLEVAENALSTVISSKDNQFSRLRFGNDDIDADYIKDYGVVFMVSDHGYGKVNLFPVSETVKSDHEKGDKGDLSSETEKEIFINNSKIFLADYAGIIGQLNETQMISIRRGGSFYFEDHIDLQEVYFAKAADKSAAKTFWGMNKDMTADSELIIEVNVAKINALRKGKIDRDEFFKSINVVENAKDYSKDADLETLSAMFHRLYKKDLSNTYYSERQPKYSKLSNFGVIVKMKFYSSYEDQNIYSMPTISKKGLTLEERNNHVMELLPQFEADFRENLVNYGRTLKNLDSDEVLLFEINMTTCSGCKDFPKVMKFSIKKSVLHKFNRGDISMKDAINMINVDRILD